MAVGLFIVLLALSSATTPVSAQYMYLDANGDGAYTPDDPWYLLGRGDTPTQIDVYLSTGGAPTCPGSASFSGYTINLYSLDAPMLFTDVVNRMPGMTETTPLVTYPYALSVGYSGGEMFPPGTYLLLSVTVTKQPTTISAGCPALTITPYSCYSPPGVVTSFESDCPGQQGDGMLRLGEDWWSTGDLVICTDNTGHDPAITCPAEVSGVEGQTITFTTTYIDPDCGNAYPMWAYPLPEGATFTGGPFVAGESHQTFTWTPSFGQAGVYPITFEVYDPDPFNMRDRRATCTTQITVAGVNRAPVADAGGPYSGLTSVPVQLDGSGSTDPDGDVLVHSWDFGDGSAGQGVSPTHTYTAPGTYPITLVTSDGQLSDTDETAVDVIGLLTATAFVTASDRTVRLSSAKPQMCVHMEPVNQSFDVYDVDLSTFRMSYGLGSIPAITGKSTPGGDKDRNGVEEVTACFAKDGLRSLFSALPEGESDIVVIVDATHSTGSQIRAELALRVTGGSGAFAAFLSPNPLNPYGVLTFRTTKPGPIRVRLFDAAGRLARVLVNESSLAAGYHDVLVDGLGADGRRLASGVYFYRIDAEGGSSSGRLVVAR